MNKNVQKEFDIFLRANAEPPALLDCCVLSEIQKRLNPPISKAVSKLFVFNAAGSLTTLALCPQYGLSLTNSHGLMPYLMQIHPAFCFFVCGGLWMIVGQMLANLFLAWDERRVLSHYYWGAGFAFIIFSVLLFACIGTLTLDLWLLAWGFGAATVVGAFNFRLRGKVARAQVVALGR